MNKTRIEWVRNPDGTQGYTWNPITGCLGSNGTPEKPNRCSYCFAHKLANGRLKQCYLSVPEYPYDDCPALLVPKTNRSDPFVPRFWRHRLREPFWYKKPCTIFVCSMGELFGNHTPNDWVESILSVCRDNPKHTFQLLTKQPQNLIKFSPFPNNCWVGVSMEGDGFAIPNFITLDAEPGNLYQFKATVKFISFEPFLYEPTPFALFRLTEAMLLGQINWIIIGAQTKPCKLPKKEWVEKIIKEARDKKIPIFLKNNLKPLMGDLIQEFPEWYSET